MLIFSIRQSVWDLHGNAGVLHIRKRARKFAAEDENHGDRKEQEGRDMAQSDHQSGVVEESYSGREEKRIHHEIFLVR
jgi:hypothetical protein